MISYIVFLVATFALIGYITWRAQDPTTRSVLAHLTLRERTIFYGIPAGYGLSMPVLAVVVALVLHLYTPRAPYLRHFVLALCFVAPVYAVVGICFQQKVKGYLRRVVAESAWARAQGIDAGQIKL